MLINLQLLLEHLDSALDEGKFPILYPEYLVRSQIAIAERLEAILDSLEVQRLGNLPTSLGKAPESNRRALRRQVSYSKSYIVQDAARSSALNRNYLKRFGQESIGAEEENVHIKSCEEKEARNFGLTTKPIIKTREEGKVMTAGIRKEEK